MSEQVNFGASSESGAALSANKSVFVDAEVEMPSPKEFANAYQRFQQLINAKSGRPFETFQDGMAAAWESYKPRLRAYALTLLSTGKWSEPEVGSGAILERVINAIEIQESARNLVNNLVFWQNRFGHANRDHHVLLEAMSEPNLRRKIERCLFDLYRNDEKTGMAFDTLGSLTGRKYPLLAYLCYLRDMDRFMPIQPTGFDRAFKALGIRLATLHHCEWTNYITYNAALNRLRPFIADAAHLKSVRLVDAHSFCWIFSTLLKQEADGSILKSRGTDGRIFGAREKSIVEMRYAVENTARNSNGQSALRTIKSKELRMTSMQLEGLLTRLLVLQGDRCALTEIRFNFNGADANKNLLPSVDRVDSDGHYEIGNIQIVCRFVNKWKSDSDNEEFKELLMMVRGMEFEEQHQ